MCSVLPTLFQLRALQLSDSSMRRGPFLQYLPAGLLELWSVELPQRASWCHVWQGSRIWHPVVGKSDEALVDIESGIFYSLDILVDPGLISTKSTSQACQGLLKLH